MYATNGAGGPPGLEPSSKGKPKQFSNLCNSEQIIGIHKLQHKVL